MGFLYFICPQSPEIWDDLGYSECFKNMIFGFGANMWTIMLIAFLGLTQENSRICVQQMSIWRTGLTLLHIVPAFEICISLWDICSLLNKDFHGKTSSHHEWIFRCSQFVAWMAIMLILNCKSWWYLSCNWFLSVWWIIWPLMEVPHLQRVFSLSEVAQCLKESCYFLGGIMFGLIINIVKMKLSSTSEGTCNHSLEEALISSEVDLEGNCKNGPDVNGIKFWRLITFSFVNPIMKQGAIKQLDFEDLMHLPNELDPLLCHTMLRKCWSLEQRKHLNQASLFRAICYAYGWPYLLLGLLKVVNDCLGFAGPLLLNKLIGFLQKGSEQWDGYSLSLCLGLTSILKSFLDTQYTYHLSKLKLKLRASIMTLVYQKCLLTSLAERSIFSVGEIQTFMSIDTDRTVNLCNSFHDMWSLPMQIGVALYLLYTQVKFAFASGIAITILLIPVNRWISGLIAAATELMMKHKDERIRKSGELLMHIRTLKMYSWELLFSNRLMETREMEVKHLSTRKYLDAWCVFFWATTPTLFSLFTFGLFALLGNQLTAATVFTCVALFNTLISPLNSFPWVINGLIDAMISTRRLSKFLSCPDINSEKIEPSTEQLTACSSICIPTDSADDNFEDVAIVFQDANCVWSSSKMEEQGKNLKLTSFEIPRGFFVVVIGEVGSGKSSLLNAILGETRFTRGAVRSCGSIAYAPQVPWILSGTVRDNILFGKGHEAKRYNEVVTACAMDVDIGLMPGGDQAFIGERGLNLSGGQRARLMLARAIYHGSDIYLLDDVLSAVDAHVASWILKNAILGPLMEQKTRIMCTHNIQAISSADVIIVMENGQMKWMGRYADFLVSPCNEFQTLKDMGSLPSSVPVEGSNISNKKGIKATFITQSDCNIDSLNEPPQITEVEQRKEGRVEYSIYKNYAVFASWWLVAIICLSAFLMQSTRNGNDFWLSHWVDTSSKSPNLNTSVHYYLAVLCIFAVMNSLLTLIRAFSFAYGGLRAALQVHNNLLSKLLTAPVYFFDQNPSGRILNRFSSDQYTIDDSLPFILNILLANFFSLVGIATVLSFVQIYFLLLLVPLWYIYKKLQFYYRCTSRELRRLDSVSRSPIYTSFNEALDGSSSIRAFKAEKMFMATFTKHVMLNQRTSYSELSASCWLSLRLQLLAACVVSFIAIIAVLGKGGGLPVSFGTPGLVGLALSYAAPLVSLLSNFLTSFTETEKEMVSVERVLEYMDIAPEDLQGCQSVNSDWPSQGEVEFHHVSLRYMPSLPLALQDVSFCISAGTQVGVVGRTGAGKSSVLNALFRLTPICEGHILIDRINVANVGVRELRARLAVVPQNPFLFEGTLRDNLDPFKVANDSSIWEVLQKCHIREEVQAAGGLGIHVKEAGVSFSVGQRQLLCLARALLKSSKVLCLDECTANIDAQTGSIIHETISSECNGTTVITIAHRIPIVLNMDNVLVLDHGILVEQGDPQVLLRNGSSRLAGFARASI
ncbi:ABC transporter C family member 13 isoform X3 [Amborella trichopoda]|uniref:ABC transporter C family member 13 isoform X3 n=1 Tax=Amborella trichopoda TaxID=13333 RepID=UPI0009BD3610|nr:ABC transporter C family member 13 isoform X3 [Amborella trichopoda]|eukprot:XP_020530905.1 ABC transporter C family member 13 isoform X3 [Amborella trichopoda]